MDNVVVDFKSGINNLSERDKNHYLDNYDEVPGIFSLMDPMPKAISSYDIYILYKLFQQLNFVYLFFDFFFLLSF